MMDSKADAAVQGSSEGYGDSQNTGGGYEAPAQAQQNNYTNQGSGAPQQQYGQQQQQQSYGSQQNNSYGNQQAQPQQNYQRQEMPSAQAIPEIDIDEDEIPF